MLNATVPGKTQSTTQSAKEFGSQDRQDSSEVFLKSTKSNSAKDNNGANPSVTRSDSNDGEVDNIDADTELPNCTICHVPYSTTSLPFNVHMKRCAICK